MYQVGIIGLTVGDLDTAIEFYQDVFAFEVLQPKSTSSEGNLRALLKSGSVLVELTQLKKEALRIPPGSIDHMGFIVADLEPEIERLKKIGVDLESPEETYVPLNTIVQRKNGRAFYFKGLNGELIELVELTGVFDSDEDDTSSL